MFSYTLNPINKWKRKVRELEKEVELLRGAKATYVSQVTELVKQNAELNKKADILSDYLADLRDAYMKHAVRKGFRTTPDSKFDERMERIKGVLGDE